MNADEMGDEQASQPESEPVQPEESSASEQARAEPGAPLSVEAANVVAQEPRRRRIYRPRNVLLAIGVIVVLIGVSVIVVGRVLPLAGPLGAPVTMSVTSGGLEMSMSFTAGPYFLSELLEVDMSLTNHTQTTYNLTGTQDFSTPCSSALQANLKGSGSPHFYLTKQKSLTFFVVCVTAVGGLPLQPGQTISTRQYLPLISSGQNTLSVQLFFPIGSYPTASYPFKNHVLSTTLDVMSQVPGDRKILSLQRNGSEVQVIAQSSAQLQLVAHSLAVCRDAQGKQKEAGSIYWLPLATRTLQDPGCPGTNEQWIYGVGAAGYAIAAGDPDIR